jgi:hypothetical protein
MAVGSISAPIMVCIHFSNLYGQRRLLEKLSLGATQSLLHRNHSQHHGAYI